MWSEWATEKGIDRADTGIDLVAEEADGSGYCAIQCKCYAQGTRIGSAAIDSFIAASARPPFTSRLVVDTGAEWGKNAKKTIDGLYETCAVLHYSNLANSAFDWPDLDQTKPEDLTLRLERFDLRAHQIRAFDDVVQGLQQADRGKLIMACGTGKTFTALRIAEAIGGRGGRVLFLVPSISLFQQSMREWMTQQNIKQRYIGICSDTSAGRDQEDATLQELERPVTTNPESITAQMLHDQPDKMTVVWCTYHSLALVAEAQDHGAPPFDLVVCDEAHRSTGVERPADDKTSPFVLVHDAGRIRANKRLYMTATPRIYTASAQAKAARHDVEVYSMDDENVFGPELHRLTFSKAIEDDLLSDYKVVVLTLSEENAEAALAAHLADVDADTDIAWATKMIGCWSVLQNPEHMEEGYQPMRRVIAFNNLIKESTYLARNWNSVINHATALLPEDEQVGALHCAIEHVDGKQHALERKTRIEWLKEEDEGVCRILTNARCLSEGIDVPALDAVLFMTSRRSQVDIVQAVGRVMRKSEGKKYGYIILPVTVPAGVDPSKILDDDKRYDIVWSVLRALRSHDDRFDAEINHLDLNTQPTKRLDFRGDKDVFEKFPEQMLLQLDLPAGAIFAKIVEKCGDRKYWETWAKDVADIFDRLVQRITSLLDDAENATLREWFAAFHDELKESINESISHANAIEMMAQHILTRPVFDALFEDYVFADGNPVAQALDALRKDFGEFGLENEIRDMNSFYESVKRRAQGLDNSDARQHVLMELYENFFATAMKKDADRLGIVYTPTEIVDFILHSADHVLRQEFGRSLSDPGVHVLDPFTGTGIFLVRLLQSGLIQDIDLMRKYREELHANEIVLLAYYIAAIHIEEAYHGRCGPDRPYEPFNGIVLGDTFNMKADQKSRELATAWLPDNSERAQRQQQLPIQVIVGNPPWSAGQRSSADDNPNVSYPEIERRVAETYAARSTAANKNSLYDTYKMAIRWAADRIGKQGIVAFVSNGSWIDGNADSGVRACLKDELTAVHVLHLRGNQRTQGELSRREGGKVFGSGSRAPVAITILVRSPNDGHKGCRILYHDIGDYLKREEKLAILSKAGSIAGIDDWLQITPDQHHDWIGQRDEVFQQFYPMGSIEAKTGKVDDSIFSLFSNGFYTGKDAYVYNFSYDACAESGRLMTSDYLGALRTSENNAQYTVTAAVKKHSTNIRWDATLKTKLSRGLQTTYTEGNIRTVVYRPFVSIYCYADVMFTKRPGIKSTMFPDGAGNNRAICVPGVGSTKPFSAVVVDTMPDLELISKGQCFPRYRYEAPEMGTRSNHLTGMEQSIERVDNISDTAVHAFRTHYRDQSITADDIFDYIYGVLHARDYGQRFANDLRKVLPRIPFARDFRTFVAAGKALSDLHLGYESCAEYPLEVIFKQSGDPQPEHFRITAKEMRFKDTERSILAVNDFISIGNIPPEAHQYEVNGRTPIGWFMDRYRIKKDSKSGKINDPNGWFKEPQDLITAFRRIVHLSVETVRIVDGLPASFDAAGDLQEAI